MSAFNQIGGYSGRNPILYFSRNLVLRRFFGHQELRAAQAYVLEAESPFAKNVMSTEHTSTRLGLVYLHFWLLDFHLTRHSHTLRLLSISRLRNFVRRRQLLYLSNVLISTEHVQIYSNEYDDQINDELRRMMLVIRHSLTAFFLHPRYIKPPTDEELRLQLDEVISSIIMKHDESSASKVGDYVRESVANESLEGLMQRMMGWRAEQINL